MSHAEWDKERIKVYWDAKRSIAISSLGFIFSMFLTAIAILSAIVQANGPEKLEWWAALFLEPIVFTVFSGSFLSTRKKLSEFTLRTLDLMDKAEKGISIDEELRKTDTAQGEAEKQKAGNGGIWPKPDQSKVSSQGELSGQPKDQVASGIEREQVRSVVVIALLGVAVRQGRPSVHFQVSNQ